MLLFRATKQRGTKRTASDANISNTTNTSNNSSDAGNGVVNTTNTVNTPVTTESVTVADAEAISATGALSNHTYSAVKESKPVVKVKVTEVTLEGLKTEVPKSEGLKNEGPKSEGFKNEGPKNEEPEKKAPITPKGKYELRASTLIPRDYGMQDEDDEGGENKKVEAVIDLTDDDDVVVTKTKEKPQATDGSGTRT